MTRENINVAYLVNVAVEFYDYLHAGASDVVLFYCLGVLVCHVLFENRLYDSVALNSKRESVLSYAGGDCTARPVCPCIY